MALFISSAFGKIYQITKKSDLKKQKKKKAQISKCLWRANEAIKGFIWCEKYRYRRGMASDCSTLNVIKYLLKWIDKKIPSDVPSLLPTVDTCIVRIFM